MRLRCIPPLSDIDIDILIFANSPLSPNGFHWQVSHVKPPVCQQPLGHTGQTQVLRSFTTHKEAVSQKKPKITPVLYLARVQLQHSSSVTQPYRARNAQHVVSCSMESIAAYALRQQIQHGCIMGMCSFSKSNTSTNLGGAPK